MTDHRPPPLPPRRTGHGGRRAPGGPLARRHRARPGQRRPRRPLHPDAGRLRGHRGQGGSGARAGRRADHRRPSTPTAAPRHLQRTRHRSEGRPTAGTPSWPWCAAADVVVESFRPGVVDRLGIGFDDLRAVNPRIILCSTTGYGQDGPRAAWAGHDINYLAVGRVPGRHRARGRRRAAGVRGHHRRRRRRGHAGGPGGDGRTHRTGRRTGPGCTSTCPSPTGCSGSRRWPSTSTWPPGPPWPTATTSSPAGTPATTPTRRADGGWLAVGAIEPKFYANLCRLLGCEQWAAHQLDDDVQDEIRADFQAAFATKDRDAWVAELAGADTCVSPVLSVAELVDDDQFEARQAFVEAVAGAGRCPARRGPAPSARSEPVLAGMDRAGGAGGGRRPAPVRHRPAAGRGRA